MAAPKSSRKGNGHGGRRPRAGRPTLGPGGTNWTKVREFARLGAERDTILLALGVDQAQLQDPDFVTRLQQEMARGVALLEIDLLKDVRRLGKGGKGKVNAVLAGLRQKLGWNRPDAANSRKALRPDAESAVAELEKVLRRVRA